jgi:hypothetical protein
VKEYNVTSGGSTHVFCWASIIIWADHMSYRAQKVLSDIGIMAVEKSQVVISLMVPELSQPI